MLFTESETFFPKALQCVLGSLLCPKVSDSFNVSVKFFQCPHQNCKFYQYTLCQVLSVCLI